MEDSKIVDLFFARDEDALCCVTEKYGKRLRALSFGIVQDALTAEECENDTYVEAWDSIPPHSPKDHLYAFLARITRHLSLNRCRDRDRAKRRAYLSELSSELEQCIPSPGDDPADEVAFADMINRFLASLRAETRNIFLRRYWFMDSVAEIAKRFDCSESKVKVALYRSRKLLKQLLEQEGYTL